MTYNIGRNNGRAKISNHDVAQLRATYTRVPTLRRNWFFSLAAAHLGLHRRQVIRIVKGASWQHVQDWTDGFRKHKPSRTFRRLFKALWDRHMLLVNTGVVHHLSSSRHFQNAKQRVLDTFFIQFWAMRAVKEKAYDFSRRIVDDGNELEMELLRDAGFNV